jgi:hypothetical protein
MEAVCYRATFCGFRHFLFHFTCSSCVPRETRNSCLLSFPGWLILSVPRGGMPELLAPCWEKSTFKWRLYVTGLLFVASDTFSFISRVSLVSHGKRGTVVFSAFRVGWYCQFPEVICQDCWLPAERNQLSDTDFVLESSFVWLPLFLFYFHFPSLFYSMRNGEQKSPPAKPHTTGCCLVPRSDFTQYIIIISLFSLPSRCVAMPCSLDIPWTV